MNTQAGSGLASGPAPFTKFGHHMAIFSRTQGWDFKTRNPYVSLRAEGPDTELEFLKAVGLAYGAALAVDEPFTKFVWRMQPEDSYACVTAVADDGDCIRGGPLHRSRKQRIARAMFNFVQL